MSILAVIKRRPIVVSAACAAATAMILISEGAYWRSGDALDVMSSAGVARTSLRVLQQSLLAAQGSQRVFLLTGRDEGLEPYRQALLDIDESYRDLERHYAAEPSARAVLDQLRALTDASIADSTTAIERREAGPGRDAVGRPSSDVDRQQMDSIRALGAQLLDLEAARVSASQADLDRALTLGRIGVAVLSLLSLLALYLFLRQADAIEEHRRLQQRLVRDERDHLELEVRDRTAQLVELTRHLLTAREDERSRLARDLHDELGALLTSAKLDAARIRSRLAGAAPEAQERLTHLVASLDAVIAIKRRISEDLRPSALSHLGLVATLEILAREFADRSGVAVHCTLAPARLRADAELVIYRVVQEAVTNITKYARATQVWLDMDEHDGQVVVTVRDDGVGFDSAAPNNSAFGLVGMRFRVEAEGGTLAVQSAPGRGTTIRATLPVAPLDAA